MDDEGPPNAIGAALSDLCGTAGLEGAAIIDCSAPDAGPALLYRAGIGSRSILTYAAALIRRHAAGPSHIVSDDSRPILACPWVLPPHRPGGLILWREVGARAWKRTDHAFGVSVAGLIRVMLENSPDESGIDRVTGLPNRLWFLDEADRHIERLARDRMFGTLMIIGIDNLDRLFDVQGRDAGDWVLRQVAALVRAAFRPTDLVARIGADEFAMWLPGMDHMTAAERAENLCERRLLVPALPGQGVMTAPSLSIGIACRTMDSLDDVRTLLRRAREAASHVRGDGGGGWHVSR